MNRLTDGKGGSRKGARLFTQDAKQARAAAGNTHSFQRDVFLSVLRFQRTSSVRTLTSFLDNHIFYSFLSDIYVTAASLEWSCSYCTHLFFLFVCLCRHIHSTSWLLATASSIVKPGHYHSHSNLLHLSYIYFAYIIVSIWNWCVFLHGMRQGNSGKLPC